MEALNVGGKTRATIIDYFSGVDNLIETTEKNKDITVFEYYGCKVEVREENITTLGIIKIPRVLVVFDGDEMTLNRMLNVFRMNFLSMGG